MPHTEVPRTAGPAIDPGAFKRHSRRLAGDLTATTAEEPAIDIFLTTGRLVLRRITEDDVDNLLDLDSDPAVMRYVTGGTPTPRAVIEDKVRRQYLPQYARCNGLGRWAAVHRYTGEFLGLFALAPADAGDDAEVELGYRLRRPAWGLGYATEGSRALIDKAFHEYGVQRVFAGTMTVNGASRRVMEKSGLRFVRVFHPSWAEPIAGMEHGEVEYELRRTDWARRARD